MNWPNEMSGSHPLASWCNKLLRAARASRVVSGVGYKTKLTTDGMLLQIEAGGGGEVPQNPFTIYRHQAAVGTGLVFRVSSGYVISTGAPFMPTGLETDISVTAGVSRFWFFLNIQNSTASLATSPVDLTWSASQVPIGFVNTVPLSPVVFQFVRDHVFSGSAAGGAVRATIVTHNGDVMLCAIVGGPNVSVAKQKKQRAVPQETIDGIVFTYVYTGSNNRTSSDGATTQQEVCYPRYFFGDEILITPISPPESIGGNSVSYAELTPRVWARRYNQ